MHVYSFLTFNLYFISAMQAVISKAGLRARTLSALSPSLPFFGGRVRWYCVGMLDHQTYLQRYRNPGSGGNQSFKYEVCTAGRGRREDRRAGRGGVEWGTLLYLYFFRHWRTKISGEEHLQKKAISFHMIM
jgi:hypothetical protein